MEKNARIQQLLDEIMESDRTPEEVCTDCPEMLPRVYRRLKRVRALEARVNLLFPAGDSADLLKPPPARAGLPQIPGYEVEAILGRGGIGIVYKARDTRLNRPVALKMLLSGVCALPHELERFHREAEAIASLRHPNIVQIFDVSRHDGIPYYTMEFIDGGNLAQKLSGAPLSARVAATLIETIGDAIQASHESGIIHRDLKASNVLLTTKGIPKVVDFGLARRVSGDATLTEAGIPVGTPSYMSPEQASGNFRLVGPSTDVYSLGAILYELLTGRPPFRADTSAETRRQVVENDPAPPSSLNAKVPRDLETICLKCLSKEPARRYATAADFAADVRRFLAKKPILARPVGTLERWRMWTRRKPLQAAVAAACACGVIAIIGIAALLTVIHVKYVQQMRDGIYEVDQLQQRLDWPDADGALERVKVELGDAGPAELRQRLIGLEQVSQDHKLVDRLDAICLDRAGDIEGAIGASRADRRYEEQFKSSGIGALGDDPRVVASRIGSSPFRAALVDALDDWSICAGDDNRRAWLMEVARRADPDPFRDSARDPKKWRDKAALAELAGKVPPIEHCVHLLVAIGVRLQDLGGDSQSLLAGVQHQYPNDFWANFWLGRALRKSDPAAAVGYFRAALAIRPRTAIVYGNLGNTLLRAGRLNESIDAFKQAIAIDSDYEWAYHGLGRVYWANGQTDEAIKQYQKVLELDPANATTRYTLGTALISAGRPDEAIAQLRISLNEYPNKGFAHDGLGEAYVAKGQIDQAIPEFRRALQLEPGNIRTSFDLAEALRATGRYDEAIDLYRRVLRKSSRWGRANYGLGKALEAKGQLAAAIRQYQEAVKVDPKFAEAIFSLTEATVRIGQTH